MTNRRITVVVTREPQRDWQRNVMFVESVDGVPTTVRKHDVERIILDRCATADEYLHLLTSLHGIAGDVMNVREDGGAYLSATGRGGNRVLYALAAPDVQFYLEAHGLAAAPAARVTAALRHRRAGPCSESTFSA